MTATIKIATQGQTLSVSITGGPKPVCSDSALTTSVTMPATISTDTIWFAKEGSYTVVIKLAGVVISSGTDDITGVRSISPLPTAQHLSQIAAAALTVPTVVAPSSAQALAAGGLLYVDTSDNKLKFIGKNATVTALGNP